MTSPADPPSRWLGLLPLVFFAHVVWDYVPGEWHQILWVCNVSTLLLGCSLLARWSLGVWVGTIWLILGAPLWLYDASLNGDWYLHSFETHLLGPAVGLAAIRRLPPPRGVAPAGVAWVIALQLLARAITPPEHNVNVAFEIISWMRGFFDSFVLYTAYNLGQCAVALFVVDRALRRFWVR